MALARGQRDVAQLLLTVPAVNTLAAHHHYYQEELRHGGDARALAEDRESSMRALTTAELPCHAICQHKLGTMPSKACSKNSSRRGAQHRGGVFYIILSRTDRGSRR